MHNSWQNVWVAGAKKVRIVINAEATSWAGLVENFAFVLAWVFFAEHIWTNVLPSRYINRRRKFISWTQWPQ